MTAEDRYGTPAAFRAALTERVARAAKESRWTVQQLQRQVAYDRLLERLYLVDDGWVVKGATALLARDLGMRGSLDIDVYREVGRGVAESDLRKAASMDIGDWFRFEVGMASTSEKTVTFPVAAVIGATTWVEFHVDLVGADMPMTGHPDDVPPLARGVIPEVEQRGYRAYPLVDHVADKMAATYEHYGPQQHPSTRYRDLVDLVSIVIGASVSADEQREALISEFRRRGVALPMHFDVPDRGLWTAGYAREAQRSLLSVGQTLEQALDIVRPFIDPLLDSTATGSWNRERRRWDPT
jgi:hypothetical protein